MTKSSALELLPLELLGARQVKDGLIYFGIILPQTTDHRSAIEGYDIYVRVIHEDDQFIQGRPPAEYKLEPGSFVDAACEFYRQLNSHQEPESPAQAYNVLRHSSGKQDNIPDAKAETLLSYSPYEKPHGSEAETPFFWSGFINLEEQGIYRGNSEDLYVYRYCLKRIRSEQGSSKEPQDKYIGEREIDWIIDPFAREFGKGKFSAFTCRNKAIWAQEDRWKDSEKHWRVPALKDLIIYEMMIDEFNEDIDGATAKLGYLKDLGINCISLMPITNVSSIVDWGYTPIGYFGIDERFGSKARQSFKAFMESAHANGIAVVFDAVYAHTSYLFCYYSLYEHVFIDNHIEFRQTQECQGENSEDCKRLIKEEYRDLSKRHRNYNIAHGPNGEPLYDKRNSTRYEYKGNPFLGFFERSAFNDDFCKGVDFSKKFARDFFFTACYYWLDEFHIDGFRYDFVPGYYETNCRGSDDSCNDNASNGFGLLAHSIKSLIDSALSHSISSIPVDYVERFHDGDRLIQSAENLEEPSKTLKQTAANCSWQNHTLDAAIQVAKLDPGYMMNLGFRLGLHGADLPAQKTYLQYIENHDKQRFVCNFKFIEGQGEGEFGVFKEGDRDVYGYNVQPYLIALLTAKGIPLLWQGQEFCENNYLPEHGGAKGLGRIRMFRPIRWNYFYDDVGQAIITLVRKLTKIRSDDQNPQFRSLDSATYYFHDDKDRYQSKGVLVYYRFDSRNGDALAGPFSIVMLNFSDAPKEVVFQFPRHRHHGVHFPEHYQGIFVDQLSDPPANRIISDEARITVNSNYGCIWTLKPQP